jgi:hypothetical protein
MNNMNKWKYLYPLNRHVLPPQRSIQGSINEIDDEEESYELPRPFFYSQERFYHLDKYDLLEWFLICDYEVIEFKENNENMLAILRRSEEMFYIFASPDKFYLKITTDERSVKRYEVNCYSSFVFYKIDGKIKLWKFKGVNELFKEWLKEYVNHLFNIPSYIL